MPVLNMMIALPACGKSTMVEQLVTPNTYVHSTDNMIEEIARQQGKTYNDVFADNMPEVVKAANQMLSQALEARADVIWDQTNLSAKKRISTIRRVHNLGYQVFGRWIAITTLADEQLWKQRLTSRPGKAIPDNVISSMSRTYRENIPSLDEGFDQLFKYNIWGEPV